MGFLYRLRSIFRTQSEDSVPLQGLDHRHNLRRTNSSPALLDQNVQTNPQRTIANTTTYELTQQQDAIATSTSEIRNSGIMGSIRRHLTIRTGVNQQSQQGTSSAPTELPRRNDTTTTSSINRFAHIRNFFSSSPQQSGTSSEPIGVSRQQRATAVAISTSSETRSGRSRIFKHNLFTTHFMRRTGGNQQLQRPTILPEQQHATTITTTSTPRSLLPQQPFDAQSGSNMEQRPPSP